MELVFFSKLIRYTFIVVVVLLNILLLKNIYEPNNALIPIGDKNIITIDDRKKIIDWMYLQANGQGFSVWIYTIPYFQDYPWEYLFLTYAKDKYGYQPERTGSFSKNDLNSSKYFFNIYELDDDNPSRQSTWFEQIEKSFGLSKGYFNSHDVHVELREKVS